MNFEESRLQSFASWPIDAIVGPRKLTENGFFATGNSLEVECNWCHSRFSDWELSDIEERHRRLNPHCEFIKNNIQCGNLPLSITSNLLNSQEVCNTTVHQLTSSNEKEHSTLDLLTEIDRLATFVNWPNPNITPQSLAKAGFFYRNRSDEVECAWCKGVIAQWEKQDNAFEEHQRFFPECPRVQLGPLIEITYDGIRELGIQQISPPINPKYTALQTRITTYSNWPIPDVQKPLSLAQAGLYYQNVDDQVRCFHCNMGLRSWEKNDDPWFEHAKWYPMCEFVRLVKGVNYIQEVQKFSRTTLSSSNPVVPMRIEEAMRTEPVKIALEMGVDENTLQNEIQHQILKTGRSFKTVEDLLSAVFNEQEDSNLENSTQSTLFFNRNSIQRQYRNRNANKAFRCVSCYHVPSNEIKIGQSYGTESSSSTKNDDNKIFKNDEQNIKIYTSQIDDTLNFQIHKKLTSDRIFLEEENRKLKDARLCKVCLDEEVGVVYLPCGHLVTCVQCAPGVTQCPMCRTAIKGFVRTYLS